MIDLLLTPTDAMNRLTKPTKRRPMKQDVFNPWNRNAKSGQPPAIDGRRKPKPVVVTESWWLDLNRVQFAAEIRKRWPEASPKVSMPMQRSPQGRNRKEDSTRVDKLN